MRLETKAAKQQEYAKIGTELSKAVAVSVPLIVSAQPGALATTLSTVAPIIFDLVSSLYRAKGGTLGTSAWTIVSSAYALALAKLIATAPLARRPEGVELETLIGSLLQRAKLLVDEQPQELHLDCLYSPLTIPFVRDAAKSLPHELSIFSLGCPVGDCRVLFENLFVEALAAVRNVKPETFAEIERALSGPFAGAVERRKALSRHHSFLIKTFTQRPIFGQEETGITLEELYVRQRAVWNTKEPRDADASMTAATADTSGSFFQEELKTTAKWRFPLHIGDLHQTVWSWLELRTPSDAIRVIAGGPGSGKSTFARALAIEVIDKGTYDVLFVPLQEIEATGSFQSRIENLFKNRTDLGLDRAENPLSWLGQRDPDGNAPERPLLIICDGLDEIAPPGSSEAATVTTDFIQALGTWMNNRNSGGHFVSAIVLGRTISAQEAFRKLGVNHHALLRVGGLLPLKSSREYAYAEKEGCLNDSSQLGTIDQRTIFWDNWCRAAKLQTSELPEALQGDTEAAQALEELTAEPLLLYLLLWTGYLDKNWKAAASNRNYVYEAIFQQIYARRWGQDTKSQTQINEERGGHTGTSGIDSSDFFLLQEALGLASWATGGRTVTSDLFQPLLKIFLDPDKYDDLSDDLSSSLKSVALQSYTRSVAADNAGFEFVHKSIGEYLIGRGLTTWLIKSLEPLKARPSDARCSQAAELLSKMFWRGSLTNEISRFFEDEIRIRYNKRSSAKSFLDTQVIPLANWVLRNGIPVHTIISSGADTVHYSEIELAEQRSTDVFWTGLQGLARLAFKLADYGLEEGDHGWQSGPIVLDWPSPHSFKSLFNKISAPNLIADNKRIARFDFLDLQGQAVTDSTLGAVLFGYNEVDQSFMPETWLAISLIGSDLSGLRLYGSNLSQADLRYANLEDAILSGANFGGAKLSHANLRRASLRRTVFSTTYLDGCDLSECDLGGAKFHNCRMSGARLAGSDFESFGRSPSSHGIPTVFCDTELRNTDFTRCDLSWVVFARCEVQGANFRGSDLSKAVIFDMGFDDAEIDGAVRNAVRLPPPNPDPHGQTSRSEYEPLIILPDDLGIQIVALHDDA